MKRSFFVPSLIALAISTAAFAAEPQPSIGIVNFANCVTDSKLGKQEQSSFEAIKTQMSSLLEDTEKQLTDLSGKFNDPEYLDGLSPQAEEELKIKFRTLNEEMNRYQNQYYQVLNQANMKVVQTISSSINSAAEKIAKDKKLSVIINKDACFYFSQPLDVTSFIVAEMDKNYQQESKKPAAANTVDAVEPAAAHEAKAK